MAFDIIMLAASLGVILFACVLFTNATEALGEQLGLHEGAVGSILAAVGTALPETIIPIIAILWFSDPKAKDVAVGAIAGAPFMLATLAFFVTGGAALGYAVLGVRSRTMTVDARIIRRDLSFFLVLYGAAVVTTFVHELLAVKIAVALGLLSSYAVYIRTTLRSKGKELEDVGPAYIARILPAASGVTWTCVQLAASLALIVVGAHTFVGYVEALSTSAGVSAMILSLIVTPIATELPEKFNSVIWMGRRKDTLALGNITGAMVFQSCFPVAFGLVGTHWDLLRDRGVTLVSAVIALASAALVLVWLRLRGSLKYWVLMTGGLLYAIFVAYLLLSR